MTVEDGTGLADADSYVDPAGTFAVGYMASHLYKTEWTAADAPTKEAACIMATRVLDASFEWNGLPISLTQALGWPRTTTATARLRIPTDSVPVTVQSATLELALALLQRNRTSDTGNGEAEVKNLGLGEGALNIEFGNDPTVATVPVIPRFLVGMLRNFGTREGGGSMVRIVRQ